jgi:outer membrane lipoprotein SlyB
MRGKTVPAILLPVILAAGLGACANNGVQPGYVNTASASGSSSASASTYGQPVGSGRVVAINDVSLQGGGGGSSGSGPGNGTMIGGLLGGLGGIAIGAGRGGVGGGLIGGVIGAVGGAIAGTIIDRHTNLGGSGGGRGIEVVVQKDDGQQVTVAQRDDGDVQLGDRVQILQDRSGVAKAVRDNTRQPDQNGGYQNAGPAPQDYRQAGNYGGGGGYGGSGGGYGSGGGNYGGGGNGNYGGNYGPTPQDYRQSQNPQNYGAQPADYGQQQRYAPPQSSTHSGYSSYQGGSYSPNSGYQNSGYQDPSGPQPQNDPRYGTLQ